MRIVQSRVAGRFLFAAAILLSEGALAAEERDAEARDAEAHRVAPYADTPSHIVEAMLKLARVGPADYVVDLGSGDGRLVIAAVKAFGARGGFGVDIDDKLVAYARAKAAEAGVADRVQFLARDLFATDVSAATVVTIYLFPAAMVRVRDKLLAELRPGTRVISHDFPFPGWRIDRIETFAAPEKNETVGRADAVLFLYTVPRVALPDTVGPMRRRHGLTVLHRRERPAILERPRGSSLRSTGASRDRSPRAPPRRCARSSE